MARSAVKTQAISVGLATGLYGLSFGALSVAAGLSVLQTQALSVLMFSGASQFAVVSILGAGGAGLSAVATSTLLGVRNGLYGVQVARLIPISGWRKAVAAQLTIDESTAVAVAQDTAEDAKVGFWTTGIAVFVCWNAITLAGALLGNSIGEPQDWGLDAAAAAAFLALLWPRLQELTARRTGALAAVLALATVAYTPAGVPVLIAATAAVLVGLTSEAEPA